LVENLLEILEEPDHQGDLLMEDQMGTQMLEEGEILEILEEGEIPNSPSVTPKIGSQTN
jgi:hypothetical protein